MVGAEQRKARPEKEVLWNGSDSRGVVEDRRVRPQTRAVMRQLRYNMKSFGLSHEDAWDKDQWRQRIKEVTCKPEKWPLNTVCACVCVC